MPPNNDRSFLNNLDALAHHQPTPDAANRALARTRAALLKSRHAHTQRRLFMRIAIPSGIAAALLAAALLIVSLESPRQASAAEQLNAAVQATKAYKGWIKISAQFPQSMTAPASTQPLFAGAGSYKNTDGSFTYVHSTNPTDPTDHNPELAFWSVPRNEIATYFFATNEIHLNTMMDIQKQEITGHPTPTTIAEIIDEQKRAFGIIPLAIKESVDGDLIRFDITLFASPEAAQKCATEYNMAFLGTSISVWVNHDHLMTRMRLDDPHGPITFNYTYNVPDIHDLYDLGVPRSAKIVDERLTQNLQTLMDRLDAHAQKTFGNYTALLANYELDANNQPSPNYGFVFLYAVHDHQWLADKFRLFQKTKAGRKPRPGIVLQSPPANWPSPNLQTLLPILHDAAPVEYWIMSGKLGWRGFLQEATLTYDTERVPDYQSAVDFQIKNVATKIWPSRINDDIGSASVHTDVLQDKDHPGLIGLHYVRIEKLDNTDGGSTWWLDPKRDDMPVEYSWSLIDAHGKPTSSSHTHYLKYAQLPNGQWYPTDWREDTSDLNPRTGKYTESADYYRLQILPSLQLDSSWFQEPHPKSFTPQPAP
jgi:hypothetical protein